MPEATQGAKKRRWVYWRGHGGWGRFFLMPKATHGTKERGVSENKLKENIPAEGSKFPQCENYIQFPKKVIWPNICKQTTKRSGDRSPNLVSQIVTLRSQPHEHESQHSNKQHHCCIQTSLKSPLTSHMIIETDKYHSYHHLPVEVSNQEEAWKSQIISYDSQNWSVSWYDLPSPSLPTSSHLWPHPPPLHLFCLHSAPTPMHTCATCTTTYVTPTLGLTTDQYWTHSDLVPMPRAAVYIPFLHLSYLPDPFSLTIVGNYSFLV